MTLSTSQEVFAAARHLPWEAMLVIHDFAWDDYEELLEVIGDRPGLRVSYDDGRLEILSPSPKHDLSRGLRIYSSPHSARCAA